MAHGPFELKSYACSVCGSPDRKPIGKKVGVAVPIEFAIVQCLRCDHVRVDPRMPDERLGGLYDEEYYRGNGFDRSIDYNGAVTAWTQAENAGIITTVATALGRSIEGVRWLDFGCGTGTLLEEVRRHGGLATGFDESKAALRSCEAKDVPILTVDDLRSSEGRFDVVSAVEVIEHVPDPVELVRSLTRMVRIGGIVYVHTENWNVVRRFPGTPYIMPEGHIQYFTPQVMRRIFSMCDLDEAGVFNRSWFLWRRLPSELKRRVPETALKAAHSFAAKLAPGFAAMPVGVRIR